MVNKSIEYSQGYSTFSQRQVMSVMTSIVRKSYTLGKSTDPIAARDLATRLSHEVMDILRHKGIDVHLHGFEQDKTKVGLYLGNHQAFGLEAFFANSFIMPDTRIVLKDDLLRVPITGKAMKSVDPIVFERPTKGLDDKEKKKANIASLRHITEQQKQTLGAGGSVLIFPEGTRQKESSQILPIKPPLFNGAYSFITDENSGVIKRQVAIITADTFRTFPFTPEQWRRYGSATRHPIQFWLDVLDIESGEKIVDFAERVKSIMEGHLRESGAIS